MVAVIGRPNVGKSTLVNALVGERVSITSRKPQTTRDRVLGVRTDPAAQYIFVDTPGFQRRHRSALNRRMNEQVTAALADVDAIVLVIEASGWRAEDDDVVRLLPAGSDRVILAISKTDAAIPVANMPIERAAAARLSQCTIAIATRAKTACTRTLHHFTQLTVDSLMMMRCRRASSAVSSAVTISRCAIFCPSLPGSSDSPN